MTVFEVKIYFDTLCPWCYIGHNSLAKAIEIYQKTYPGGSRDTFNFTFLPYYVNPNLPSPGLPWEVVVARKNGQERVNAIRTRLQRVGRAHNIEFKFGKVGNTRDSHRLIQWVRTGRQSSAEQSGLTKQKDLMEAIYRMHFEEENSDLTQFADLARAAVAAGLDEEEVRAFLESGAGAEEVDDMVAQAKSAGVSSVPTVEIGGQRVEGAEDVSVFIDALVAVKEKEQSVANH